MVKLIYVQLETCHANPDGVAWYAYFDGPPTVEDLESAFDDESKVEQGSLGRLDFDEGPEEVSSPLSQAAGFRRYYVSAAG